MENITVCKESFEFLKYMLFGSWNSIYIAASERAYRDMCRTLRLDGTDSTGLRDAVDKTLEKEISDVLCRGFSGQEEYDLWHREICFKIQKIYIDNSIGLTVGQAQKWLNMTMKYLFVANMPGTAEVFPFCHVPIDSYIINAVEKQLGVKRFDTPWSKISDYETYLDYQKSLREKLGERAPLEWEFGTWLSMASGKKGAEHQKRSITIRKE